jgi:uncharacterized protein (DUF2147 family)
LQINSNSFAMKKMIMLFASVLFLASQVAAQADRIVGFWLTEKKDAQVQIVKSPSGKYNGAIVWLDKPFEDDGRIKVDDENPDPKLQNRQIMGLPLLNNFVYNSKKKEWSNGTIYDPDSGNTYDCYMWFEEGDPNVLHMKGFILGMRFIGRSSKWIKESNKRQ